jgi:hypothetical protein
MKEPGLLMVLALLHAPIHRPSWRDCPKRGTNNALSADLDVLGSKNGSKSAVLVLCKATGQAPLTLFGQSLRSTLAIWPRITSHRLGSLHRSLGLFAGWSVATTRKKSPYNELAGVGGFILKKGQGTTSPIQHGR